MSLRQALFIQFEQAVSRGWDRMYWAVDLHSTLILPTYDKMKAEDVEYYPHAKDVMQMLTGRPDMRTIMYTCSRPAEVEEYQKRFRSDGIRFNWVNENPDVNQTEYGDYSKKIYFNLLLDDKAGFNPHEEWEWLAYEVARLPRLTGPGASATTVG